MGNRSSTSKKRIRICVSIAHEKVKDAVALAKKAEAAAHIVEIRLDALKKPAVKPFIQEIKKPLLFTNRPIWEGGNYSGGEAERIGFLVEAVRAGAAYVDIELKTDIDLRNQLLAITKNTDTQVIISAHDFEGTSNSQKLASVFHDQSRSGADIGKIVTTANSFQDVIHVLRLQELADEADFPLIAFCMGKKGIISRVATTQLGGYMTYAASDDGEATAPGQLKVSAMRSILRSIADAS